MDFSVQAASLMQTINMLRGRIAEALSWQSELDAAKQSLVSAEQQYGALKVREGEQVPGFCQSPGAREIPY